VCTDVGSADGGSVEDIGVDGIRAGGVGAVAWGQKDTVKEENVNSSTTLVFACVARSTQGWASFPITYTGFHAHSTVSLVDISLKMSAFSLVFLHTIARLCMPIFMSTCTTSTQYT
jgi:hypothetical protein